MLLYKKLLLMTFGTALVLATCPLYATNAIFTTVYSLSKPSINHHLLECCHLIVFWCIIKLHAQLFLQPQPYLTLNSLSQFLPQPGCYITGNHGCQSLSHTKHIK